MRWIIFQAHGNENKMKGLRALHNPLGEEIQHPSSSNAVVSETPIGNSFV